ncbi:glycosyltransferase family 4 protein [Saccharicrinis aurantiacus]|uniref:glycosyltransferase family 4 protein n=1 Tax=Saccharicrinis aurantiacus TaxID=1849719 RepID=UPI00083900BC|nr:glycosyltransferase family 4 protein [Saccharicrinis aurantiacus]
MKTVLIAHKYSDNSFAAMSKALAIKLAKDGHQVIFLSHKKDPPFVDEYGVKVFNWPDKRPNGIKSLLLSLKLHFKYKPDISIAHFSAVQWVMLSGFLSRTKKRMAYYHTLSEQIAIDDKITIKSHINKMRNSLMYRLFTTHLIPVSKYAKKDFRKTFCTSPFLRPEEIVCNNGIPDRYKNSVSSNKSISKPIIINYLGRIDESKGLTEVVDFVIADPKLSNLVQINIGGKGSLSTYFSELNNPSIKYLGLVNYTDIDKYLQSGHFTIIPSKIDNLPTVGLESLMNGTPVIGNTRGGIPEIVSDNENGILFDGLSDNELTKLFERILSVSGDEYEQMRTNSRKSYLNKFSIDTYLENMYKIIM